MMESIKNILSNNKQIKQIFHIFAIFILFFYMDSKSYLYFHTAVESISIIISSIIFVISTVTYRHTKNGFIIIIGYAFICNAILTFLHMATYAKMNIIFGWPFDCFVKFWIASRFLLAGTFIIAPIYFNKKINKIKLFLVYGSIYLLLFLSITYFNIVPACYIPDKGLTDFKVYSEYVIIAILIVALVLMNSLYRKYIDVIIPKYLNYAIIMMIASELSFTLYKNVSDNINVGGHFFNLLMYLFIYQSIVTKGFEIPYTELESAYKKLEDTYEDTIEGWAKAMEYRDYETKGHSVRTKELTILMAKKLELKGEGFTNIVRGAILHDIGKLSITDSILLKPGKLTDEEFEIMKKHTTYAYNMLKDIDYLKSAIDIPYSHHEKWDGTGYPNQLEGEKIPLAARVFAFIDVYDALISERPYKRAWTKEEAKEHIMLQVGKHFDPNLVETFFEVINEYEN